MPIDPNATIEITAYSWVPPFAKGLVRDLRVRWALEEIGLPYRVRLFDRRTAEAETRIPDQPFGQVPAFYEGDVRMFESGAIVLYLAERSDILMPRDEAARTRTLCWAFAALNSIEPPIMQLVMALLFDKDKPWAQEQRRTGEERVRGRLSQLAAALGGKDWLEGQFSAGDLLMTSVLQILRSTDLVAEHPNLANYLERAKARPAYIRALDAQMADFINDEQERISA
jgi:glutathione S-transferase